jgi:catechol 2,3-dioxygenase-like lactoylglutathione lyase family enzyme
MLSSGKIVGFIPTKDYDKARAFYEGKLGFEFESLDKFALVMSVGGHMIRIVKIPNFTPLLGTILGWQVENIETVAAWLRDRGVPPEKYPGPKPRHLDHPRREPRSTVQRPRRQHPLHQPACRLTSRRRPLKLYRSHSGISLL